MPGATEDDELAQDDAGERTEAPTPRRREEAREKGQIPRSADLSASVVLLAGVVLLRIFGGNMLEAMTAMTAAIGEAPDLSTDHLLPWTHRVGALAALALGPFLGLLVLIAVVGTIAQSGLVLTWSKLAPKLDAVNPVTGLRRLFSFEAATRLGLGLLKLIVVGWVAYATVRGQIGEALSAGGLAPAGVLALATTLIYKLALRMALVLLVIGLIDYLLQRYRIEKSMKMTKQEVRDELKRMEGDPIIKQRRRQLQLKLAMQRIQHDVPKADVIVTNPTEFAVALRYDDATMGAPRVVAKGRDFLALRIRQVAQQHRIPIVQRPPLARALYAQVEIGQEVPARFYRAVAEVLAFVYQLSGRAA